MRRILEIKRDKAKPGLKEAIQLTLKRKAQKDEQVRRRLKKKIMSLYEKEISQTLKSSSYDVTQTSGEPNSKYIARIILQIDRLHKILAAQSAQIVSLEKKMLGKSISRTNTLNKFQNDSALIGKKDSSRIGSEFNLSKQATNHKEEFRKTFGQVARILDDNLSESSDDDRNQFDHLDEIARIAVKHNDFSISVDPYAQQNTIGRDENNKALNELLDLSGDSDDDSEQMLTTHN